ncbi:MAG TPA: flagellar motor protein MotB [Bryobacteraceae bacterium]|jgi:chemotaxis protein MotB
MARKKKPEAPENHERWLVSYADFITLLFAFFVVMFASSQTDKAKARQISQAVESALDPSRSSGAAPSVAKILGGTVDDKGQGNAQMKGPGGAQKAAKEAQEDIMELLPSMKNLNAELKSEIADGKIEVSLEPRGLVVSMKQTAFFPSGGDFLDPATLPILSKIAGIVNAVPNPILIEGHTDSQPIHTAKFPSNWQLSTARSIAMLDILTSQFNVNRSRAGVVGFADNVPEASNDTPEGRSRNRRVDIVILNSLVRTRAPGAASAAKE